MAILSTGNTWANADQVTAALLNQSVNAATFATGIGEATDGTTTEVSSGSIIVKDSGITPAKLSTGGPSWVSGGVVSLGDVSLTNANPEILGGDTNGVMYVAPSTTKDLGGNILLYGDTHASKAKDIEIRATTGVEAHYDDSASTWDFQANAVTTTGVITGGTVEATTDTAAGDNAAMGYTATEGLILTGQGSTNDVTIKNDADTAVISIPTGTTNARVTGNLFVGIDDTDPSGLIQVHGGGAGQAEGGEIRLRTAADYDSTYNHYFIDAYQDDLRIGREGGADITLSSSGNVGIGTTTPSTALQVVGAIRGGSLAIGTDDTTAGVISAYGDGTGSSEGGQLNLYIAADYDSTYNRWQIDAYEDDLRIFTDVAEVIRVTPTGNVGIGITTPSTALQVVGGIRVGADGNEDLLLKRGTPAVTVGGSTAAGIITTTGTGAGSGHVGIEVPANDADDGFYIATDSDLDGTVDNLAVKIIANGNVGIGTASPAEKLHVSGNIMLDNNTALLSKRVLGDTLNLIGINNTGQGSIEIGEASTVPDGMFIYTPTDAGQGVTFHNGTDPLMFIENDGNVGIGTDSPTEQLDLSGDAIRIRTAQTPASATATGTAGTVCWDASYIYVCTATNTWKRVAIATW
jgi:hypothetical protein